jgi:hypothetical protein
MMMKISQLRSGKSLKTGLAICSMKMKISQSRRRRPLNLLRLNKKLKLSMCKELKIHTISKNFDFLTYTFECIILKSDEIYQII